MVQWNDLKHVGTTSILNSLDIPKYHQLVTKVETLGGEISLRNRVKTKGKICITKIIFGGNKVEVKMETISIPMDSSMVKHKGKGQVTAMEVWVSMQFVQATTIVGATKLAFSHGDGWVINSEFNGPSPNPKRRGGGHEAGNYKGGVAFIELDQKCTERQEYDNEDDGQQQSESPLQSSSANGISDPGIGTQNIEYATPGQLGTGHPMVPPVYPYPDPYYRSIFAPYDTQPYPPQSYSGQPMVHLQLMGMQQAGVPLPTDAVEEPVFVNAKQYHVHRLFDSHASMHPSIPAPVGGTYLFFKQILQPYLHESRHLHALRRARGCGGRFLNSKKNENEHGDVASPDKSQSTINLNSDRNDLT
ncbi:hypothetical protein SESBI_10617 [Sesbania bispinosa]|nr:hypothetical protein SESBI_10617 [Sesbania bispinosa]